MAPRLNISPEVEDYIVKHYQSGKPNRLLTEELGISDTSISRLLRKRGVIGVRTRQPNTKFTSEIEQAMKSAYLEGQSLTQIGKLYGCGFETVYKILLRHETPMRPPGGRFAEFTDEQVQEMVNSWHLGMSQQAIANGLGISQGQVSRILRIRGLVDKGSQTIGKRNGQWKGGRIVANGYVQILVDPNSPYAGMRNSQGYVAEHRLIMAEKLGRPLTRKETVHHVNGDTTDNDPSNLQLRQGNHGKGAKWHCADCGSTNVVAVSLD